MTECPKNKLLSLVIKGVEQSSLAAIAIAKFHKLSLIVWRDGEVAKVTPEEYEKQLAKLRRE